MPQSFFRKIARQQSYVARKASPYSIDIDTTVPLEVVRFEKVGETMAVVGRNLLDNREIRMFRKWSRSAQNKRPNPMFAASEAVRPGGVMLFSGVDRLERSSSDRDYVCTAFRTITIDPTYDATIHFGDAVFLDPAANHGSRLTHQIYNIIQRDEARLVRNKQELVHALREAFENHTEDDSLLIRGVSRSEQNAAAIRVFYNTNEDFTKFLYRFRDEEHVIDVVGADDSTTRITGNWIIGALDPENAETSDMSWEVIPVKGLRKLLSARNPARQTELEIDAKARFDDFIIQKATTILGYHRAVVAVRSQPLESGASIDDIVTMYHDPGAPLPLAAIDTDHNPDLLDVLPNIAPKPIEYGEAGDYEVQDLEALLGGIAGGLSDEDEAGLDALGMDILDALDDGDAPDSDQDIELAAEPVAEAPEAVVADSMETPEVSSEAAKAVDPPASDDADAEVEDLLDFDVDLLFGDEAVSDEDAAPAPVPAETDHEDLTVDLTSLNADDTETEVADAPSAPEAADPEVAAPAEPEPSEADFDLKIDISALAAPAAAPEGGTETPQEAAADEEIDLRIDLSALSAEGPAAEPHEPSSDPEPLEDEGFDDLSLKIDLSSLSAEPDAAEPAVVTEEASEEASIAPDPAPSDEQAEDTVRPGPADEAEDGSVDLYASDDALDADFDVTDFMKSEEPAAEASSVAEDLQDTPDETPNEVADVPDEDTDAIFKMFG